jgi:hypothetical protein
MLSFCEHGRHNENLCCIKVEYFLISYANISAIHRSEIHSAYVVPLRSGINFYT